MCRGELVEIGGGVRIPDIVRRAGGKLVEVGTTNRTRAADFEAVAGGGPGAARPARPSVELRQAGFAESPDPPRSPTAHVHGAIVVDDLGSGALLDTAAFGLAHEPTPAGAARRRRGPRDVQRRQARRRAAGRVRSSDGADLVAKLRRDPLARAMRPDKVILAAVAATLGLYRGRRRAARGPGLAADRGAGRGRWRRGPGWRHRGGGRRARRRRDRGDSRWRVAAGTRRWRRAVSRSGRPAAALRLARLRAGRRRSSGGSNTTRSSLDLRTIEPATTRRSSRRSRRAVGEAPSTGGRLVIGTAGHIDHGKTTLLRALTGIDADRLPEERRRGMTIDVGYAHLLLDDGRVIDFVDVPGHDRLVGNMLVGAGEIDAALLVVAADDGPNAQTFEHLELLDALGIRRGLAVVTKADLAAGRGATGGAARPGRDAPRAHDAHGRAGAARVCADG